MNHTATAKLKLRIGGTLIPGEHVYIERPSDRQLIELLKQGEYCNVLTSRQMGKSSLMMQTAAKLSAEGYHVATPDASLLGKMVDADQWYRALLAEIADELALAVAVNDWWRECTDATPNQRLLRFFREEVAAKVPGDKPIVLFMDEIDGTLDLDFSDDFFLAMRAMYNQRALTPEYRRIAFCPVGVASPSELIKDKRKTPYNIGKTIELRDFDAERDDLSPLSRYVGGDETLGEILRFTGGHPYLSTLIAEKFVTEGYRLAQDVVGLIQAMFGSLDEALRDPHFSYIQGFLAQRAEDPLVTLKLYREILRGDDVKDQVAPAYIALKLAGIVKRGSKGALVVRNEIYRRLFTDEWAARTAESETRDRVETEARHTAARIHEASLRGALDDYKVAFRHYQSLRDNPAYEKRRADELWAGFFERRAARAEQMGQRDEAILWRLRASEAAGNETRARSLQSLIAPDYPRLEFSFCHQAMGIREIFLSNLTQIVAFSPGGNRIVTAGSDGTARLWSAETGAPIGEPMRHERSVRAVAFSPDGARVLTGSWDKTARLWSAETGAPIGEPMRHEQPVPAVAFSPDGARVLTGSVDHTARLWSAETGAPIGESMRHERSVLAVAFSSNGARVLTGSQDNTARLWSAETGAPIGEPMRHEQPVRAVAFSPDGARVLTGSDDHTARLWSAETGAPIGELMRHEDSVQAVAFSPDGARVLTGSDDHTARLWSAETGAPIGEPMRHEDPVFALAFGPDGARVLTGSIDNTARLWSAETGAPIAEPMRHEAWVQAVAFSPDGARLLTGSSDKTARLWSAETGAPIGEPMRHEGWVRAMAFSPNGARVLTGSFDKTARLWSAGTGAPIGEPMRHEAWVQAVAFSPDGARLLTGSSDKTARLWSAEAGAPIGEPMRHEDAVRAMTFSPDSARVLTGSDDHTARLWSVGTGAPIGEPMRHDDSVRAVAFSPDGAGVLTGSDDKTARLWSAETGAPIAEPMRHEQSVLAVAFSPDGACMLTGSLDNTARLWNAETGALIGEPMRYEDWLRAVAFSPDGARAFAVTQWWLHVAALDDEKLRPLVSRLLPGPFRWESSLHFLDAAGSRVQVGLGVTGNSTRVATIALDYSDAAPIAGDPKQLLTEWQRRLGLKINDAGKIVPLWP